MSALPLCRLTDIRNLGESLAHEVGKKDDAGDAFFALRRGVIWDAAFQHIADQPKVVPDQREYGFSRFDRLPRRRRPCGSPAGGVWE